MQLTPYISLKSNLESQISIKYLHPTLQIKVKLPKVIFVHQILLFLFALQTKFN
ncbi:hypothetical protein GIB67_011660 [Kingdonia uniflora]|uniref:Uncharacterized protein n=1 Tax=Kingdonia uniflora TaxID=39325 RepID=A0A7J7N9Q0_9MAGN|nr:hypothetical protein GIB67_011660 [Kingdonia uniflora]